jgi:hypothetical protein
MEGAATMISCRFFKRPRMRPNVARAGLPRGYLTLSKSGNCQLWLKKGSVGA